jgi:hypothetical protein
MKREKSKRRASYVKDGQDIWIVFGMEESVLASYHPLEVSNDCIP